MKNSFLIGTKSIQIKLSYMGLRKPRNVSGQVIAFGKNYLIAAHYALVMSDDIRFGR